MNQPYSSRCTTSLLVLFPLLPQYHCLLRFGQMPIVLSNKYRSYAHGSCRKCTHYIYMRSTSESIHLIGIYFSVYITSLKNTQITMFELYWIQTIKCTAREFCPITFPGLRAKSRILRRCDSERLWHSIPFWSRHCFLQIWQYHRSFWSPLDYSLFHFRRPTFIHFATPLGVDKSGMKNSESLFWNKHANSTHHNPYCSMEVYCDNTDTC